MKKDSAVAIDAYKKELASVPVAQTQAVGTPLQDTFILGETYWQSTPPDYLDCAFYAARAATYAPEPFKSQWTKIAKYCYKQYHGADDGYDAVVTVATVAMVVTGVNIVHNGGTPLTAPVPSPSAPLRLSSADVQG